MWSRVLRDVLKRDWTYNWQIKLSYSVIYTQIEYVRLQWFQTTLEILKSFLDGRESSEFSCRPTPALARNTICKTINAFSSRRIQ